ncbi:MAG: response regulator [Deltaproteobacteria bacterium]|nr:response regulator [Deltaproteobacteria bacterium]
MEFQQKILIVDDDKKNIKILSIMLADDYEVITATSGEEALDILESFIPDIVLLDIMMPGTDGYEVCRIIRTEKLLADIKILLVTAKTDLQDRLKGYEVGADDYITKPFTGDELLAKVKVFARLNEEENKLKQLNHRLLLRQQDIPNMLWECDNDLRFTWVDDTSETILNYSPAELLGKPVTDFLTKEEAGEFYFTSRDDTPQLNRKISGLTFTFAKSDGQKIPLQVFADRVVDDHQTPHGMVGIFRDMGAFSKLADTAAESSQEMSIRVDQNNRLVHIDENARRFLAEVTDDQQTPPDFLQYLADPALSYLFSFAFDQKEDIPFPVEIKLTDGEGISRGFSVRFKYNPSGPFQEGQLDPVSAKDQLDLVSQKMKSQNKTIADQKDTLQNAVILDSEMQGSILKDAQNLSAEILDLTKSLAVFAFPGEGRFNLEEYGEFLFNRNLQVYSEDLRLLGNKIHGLKGSCGFLMPSAKELCHCMEDITRPLAENRLVLTESLSRLLKQFIFKIDEMLEQFQADPNSVIKVDDWLEKIESALTQADSYINGQVGEFGRLINERSVDGGEIRQRKKEEYLSVSFEGYETLSEKVKELFYALSMSLNDEESLHANTLYNEFLSTHQQIKKVPLNLSRYERLIPKLAKDYGKEADFYFKDHQVKADLEFWNGIHEILNHVLKNAVIHGVETPAERIEKEKDSAGNISVELQEDAMHIRLTVSDDGRGIDTNKLAEKAVKEGFLDAGQPEQMTEDELLQLLFLQGVSTVDSLDDNAGRGVGMNAVQETILQLQGECQIANEPGIGCRYEFSFQKSNVSLPCVIVTIDDLSLAFSEDNVETFIDYNEQDIVTVKQKPSYRYNGSLVPLVNASESFGKNATRTGDMAASVMILRGRQTMKGLVINKILHHANLPILPLPKIYRKTPIYQGLTIFNKDPVQVINVEKLA